MKTIQLSVKFLIHEGKLDEFKTLGEQCMQSTKEKDTGTLQYDWFFSPDKKECVVRETYEDSNALLAHIGNLGDLLGKLLAISDFSPEIYGNASDALVQATAPFNPKIYSFYQGLK